MYVDSRRLSINSPPWGMTAFNMHWTAALSYAMMLMIILSEIYEQLYYCYSSGCQQVQVQPRQWYIQLQLLFLRSLFLLTFPSPSSTSTTSFHQNYLHHTFCQQTKHLFCFLPNFLLKLACPRLLLSKFITVLKTLNVLSWAEEILYSLTP